MKYGDFASLVQLGVGLHLGTALLQMYGEIGMAPVVRMLTRIRQAVEADEEHSGEIKKRLVELDGSYEIFKIQFFNEYKKYIKLNAVVAALLVFFLILIAYKNDEPIPALVSVLFVYTAVIPAPSTLAMLWGDAERAIAPLRSKAAELEKDALRKQTKQK
jgi:hypothetical protein